MDQSGKARSLFVLPTEIRAFVYEHYFSDEELQLNPYVRITEIGPHTLILKKPLLQSSRVILTEALPVFYRYYLFRIQIPALRSVKFPPECPPQVRRSEDIRYLTPVLPLITRLELVETYSLRSYPARSYNWDTKVAPYLQCLYDHCLLLRFLRLNILLGPKWLLPHLRSSYKRGLCTSSSFSLLAQLLQRLESLQIIFVHLEDDKVAKLCESIAPKACWIQDASMEVHEGERRTSVWSFHHSTKVLENTVPTTCRSSSHI